MQGAGLTISFNFNFKIPSQCISLYGKMYVQRHVDTQALHQYVAAERLTKSKQWALICCNNSLHFAAKAFNNTLGLGYRHSCLTVVITVYPKGVGCG